MLGLSGYLGIALAVSLAATSAASWLAWHEHGIAVAQASRDRAQIAQVQAQATAHALSQQQVIDRAALLHTQTMLARETAAYNALTAGATRTATTLARADHALSALRYTLPVTSCGRQSVPATVKAQMQGVQ